MKLGSQTGNYAINWAEMLHCDSCTTSETGDNEVRFLTPPLQEAPKEKRVFAS